MSPKKSTSYTLWQPSIDPEQVYAKTASLMMLQTFGEDTYWVESRPENDGRYVVVRSRKGQVQELTPSPYYARTRVHEYGGYSYTVAGDWLYFTNFTDQRIYRQNLSNLSEIEPLTEKTEAPLQKFLEMSVSPDGRYLLAVMENEFGDKENENVLVVLDLSEGLPVRPQVIASGADFYIKPSWSPSGKSVAWLQWNHPYMRWDSTELYVADFSKGNLTNNQRIYGGNRESIWDIEFGPNGTLFFSADHPGKAVDQPENYINIFSWREGQLATITKSLWDHTHLKIHNSRLFCIKTEKGLSSLLSLNLTSGEIRSIGVSDREYYALSVTPGGRIVASEFGPTSPHRIFEVGQGTIRQAFELDLEESMISHPEMVEFPTRDGQKAYGYLYLPKNDNYQIKDGELPPVRVILHGGPTGQASRSFRKSHVYWTSQGYAIFDVNYRGSTGFGRHYRDALLGKWGLVDVDDVEDGLRFLQKNDRVSRIATVSGGSAGGYSVQRLLTDKPDLFQAGASHFGIGNLVTLQKLTHKYESRYLVQLMGGSLEDIPEVYKERSPINHLAQLKAPMIIFQGSDDKVVPPENSREMAAILAEKNILHEYHEYEGESHGFRKKANLIDALTKEAQFFKKVILSN